MVFWVDEYRPRGLNNLDLYPEITNRLRKLASTNDIPHMLFFGPSGAGKRTRINALLREIYGPGVEKTRVTQRSIETKSKTIEIASLTSSYHIEINPSDAGNADTFVVQEVIKEIAMTQSVSAVSRILAQSSNSVPVEMSDEPPTRAIPSFKVVILHEVDRLSADAQHGLRRTMEQYTGSCRLILCAESACRITPPLKSRCLLIRVPAPEPADVARVLSGVASKQKLNIPPELLQRLVATSNNSLRRGLLALEATVVAGGGALTAQSAVRAPEWELYCKDIVRNILEEQSPARLLLVRAQFYQLLTNCIPADVILQEVADLLCDASHDMVQHQVMRWRAFYDHRLAAGTKPIFHLEAFVAKVMAIIKAVKAAGQ